MVNSSPWTNERIEKLKVLHSEGLSCSQIGAAIGVSKSAVISKIHRLVDVTGVAKPRRKRKASVKPTAPPIGTGRAVTMLELGPHDCRAPLDERNSHGDKLYCGSTLGIDWNGKRSSYCPHHHARFRVAPKVYAA